MIKKITIKNEKYAQKQKLENTGKTLTKRNKRKKKEERKFNYNIVVEKQQHFFIFYVFKSMISFDCCKLSENKQKKLQF